MHTRVCIQRPRMARRRGGKGQGKGQGKGPQKTTWHKVPVDVSLVESSALPLVALSTIAALAASALLTLTE